MEQDEITVIPVKSNTEFYKKISYQKISTDWKATFKDVSFWTLLFANVYAIYWINKNNVSTQNILLIYWFQSVTIGIVNVFNILLLKSSSSFEGLKINGASFNPSFLQLSAITKILKNFLALFFAFHYGGFHFVYFIFIIERFSGDMSATNWGGILSISALFFATHVFSFIYNFKKETENKSLGKLMTEPYLRIIPMHLAIIFGAFAPFAMRNILLILKTIVDLVSHARKHKGKRISVIFSSEQAKK